MRLLPPPYTPSANDRGAVAIGESFADGVYGGGRRRIWCRQPRRKAPASEGGPYKGYADWVNAGEGIAGGDDRSDCAGAGGGRSVSFAGGFSGASAGGAR